MKVKFLNKGRVKVLGAGSTRSSLRSRPEKLNRSAGNARDGPANGPRIQIEVPVHAVIGQHQGLTGYRIRYVEGFEECGTRELWNPRCAYPAR